MPAKNKRVQVAPMYLHPDTVRVIDAIKDEMAVHRGVAVDEIVRRYRTAENTLRSLRDERMQEQLAR